MMRSTSIGMMILVMVMVIIRASASSHATASDPLQWTVDNFIISYQTDGYLSLTVYHIPTARTVWQSTPKQWLTVHRISNQRVEQYGGTFHMTQGGSSTCSDILVTDTAPSVNTTSTSVVIIQGKICGGSIGWLMNITSPIVNHLKFDVQLQLPPSSDLRTGMNFVPLAKDERYYGMGHQYTNFDLSGKRVPVFSSEKGTGRGLQPLTDFMNKYNHYGGGDAFTSYVAVPQCITNYNRSIFLENTEYSVFDFTQYNIVNVETNSTRIVWRLVAAESPLAVLTAYTAYSGRMTPLPDWLMSGAVIGMEGGTDVINTELDHIAALMPSLPIAGIWMQDWCGNRAFPDRIGVWWNWQLDDILYHDWQPLRQRTSSHGIRLLTYINPMLADISAKVPPSHDNLYLIARAKGYLVRQGPNATIWQGYNGASLIDLTNPEARTWYKQLIHTMIKDVGSSGWMADFGESLPLDAILYNGGSSLAYHNQWPVLWQQLNQEAIAEMNATDEVIYFSRSGGTLTPSVGSVMWLGDQLVTWDGYDGLRTVVTSLLSSSVSGYTLTHSDIGGYTMLNITFPQTLVFTRSKQLFWRWCELAAFTTMYRSHPGSIPYSSWQYNSDDATLLHFGRFAQVYASWVDYRRVLMTEVATKGWPLARPLFLHYPSDAVMWTLTDQFMVGSQFIVAPVLDQDRTNVHVYLPAGEWTHIWTNHTYGNPTSGTWINIDAPLGSPAVFTVAHSSYGASFMHQLRQRRVLKL